MEQNKRTYASSFYGKRFKVDPDVYKFEDEKDEIDELLMTDEFLAAIHKSELLKNESSSKSEEVINLIETANSQQQQQERSPEKRPEVDLDSLRSLRPRGMLNDTVVEFYMNYLLKKSDIQKTKRVHLFSSFFFGKLKKLFNKAGDLQEFKQLTRSWHKNISLMDKDYLVIPICESAHWLLVIICFPNKISTRSTLVNNNVITLDGDRAQSTKRVPSSQACLVIFDSLGYKYLAKFCRPIRAFLDLRSEYELGKRQTDFLDYNIFCEHIAKVPRQTNTYDCGVHLLYNFEKFISQPGYSLRKITDGESLEYEWAVNTENFRNQIRRICETIGQMPKG